MRRCFFSSVQSLSSVQLFAIPWTAARQASLSITNSWSLLKLMSIESVIPSNHLILCFPLLLLPSIFPSIKVFSNKSVLLIGGQSIGVSGWRKKAVSWDKICSWLRYTEDCWNDNKGFAAAAAKLLQSCPTLCDPIDGSHQAPPSLGFSRQEHWSGLPFPPPMH